ncbi:MAG: DUF86 domain-containing protein [Microcoleaceae cyanobacterium]
MISRKVGDYLEDILEALESAIEFIEGMGWEEFEQDKKTIFAVTRAIQILGEAAKKVPDSVRSQYPEIPWRAMAGMRDKVTHEYFGVDLRVLWDTVQQDLPPLVGLMQRVIDEWVEE